MLTPTIRDNEELEKGKQIDELFKAIEESRFFIIVFSKNYASSSWCLKEVTKIMECQDEKEQIAYPLFYDVEPSDIRYQTGPVGRVIFKHKTNEQIKKWENALESASNLVGWNLKNISNGSLSPSPLFSPVSTTAKNHNFPQLSLKNTAAYIDLLISNILYTHEAEAIKIIVEIFSLKLHSHHLINDENLIGMEHRMQDLEWSLMIGLNDKARMIGIKGMGGIGKTTLARAIFNKVSSHFEGEDVREVSEKKGLQSLQEKVLLDVLNDEHMRVGSVYDGKKIMKMRLPYIKILLVLDDVDNAKQLEALAGDWFKDGSRIIITTRDEKVLLAHGVKVNWIHDVGLLSDKEAVSLFVRCAFNGYNIPDQWCIDLSVKLVCYAAGLPLTIKVLGSLLRGEDVIVCRDVLKRLETIPNWETLEVLEISYDGLEDDHKEIFLHVACFMTGLDKDTAIEMLDSCGFSAAYGLKILEQKSLITILNDELGMHDKIEELGKNIVRRSHPHEPNKHSRLWIPEEIEELFSGDSGTEAPTCIGMELDAEELPPEIIRKGLGNLNKLRYLNVIGGFGVCLPSDWTFDQTKQYVPNSLQFLGWNGYPGLSLPQTFRANNLVGLELPRSRIVQLWERGERKVLKKLRFLDLSDSMLRTLDLGMTPNLESLDLSGCDDLTELHVPAGCQQRLVHLDLVGCSRFTSFLFIKRLESLELFSFPKLSVHVECLEELPRDSRNNLPMLQFKFNYFKEEEEPSSTGSGFKCVYLDLKPCTKLESVSGSICGLQHLRRLRFYGCIPEVPNDLDVLKCLEKLTLSSTHIKCLPDSVCMLKRLKSLRLRDCMHLEELPENLGCLESLEKLSLLSTSIRRLPDSICMLNRLKILRLQSCLLLEEVPKDLGRLACLEKLNLISASIKYLPDSICMLKQLESSAT
ncbi:unnamed protein product [Lactuca saligna]|uniref:TIR domain-containing protein n=1 Tax=Lactuca saligna TaxID=75948 RepID=A0AA35YRI0_LACSI|nr:unnamed protein product [Lactuca saligna]